jgi:Zn-dependent protease
VSFGDILTPDKVILIAIFLLFAFPVHEFAHAAVAYMQGDATAKMFGRLTLNPIVHFDPLGGLLTVVSILFSPFLFGWAKPTPVNPVNLRDRRNGEVLVALAGPASNLLMAVAGAFVIRLIVALEIRVDPLVATALTYWVLFNVALAIFNLIPVPPLDGSAILFRFLSPRQAWELRPLIAQYGLVIVLVGVLVFRQPISALIYGISNFLVGA